MFVGEKGHPISEAARVTVIPNAVRNPAVPAESGFVAFDSE